jgi:MarR family transcriptional regulator, transcriptional regulator for hemolysin
MALPCPGVQAVDRRTWLVDLTLRLIKAKTAFVTELNKPLAEFDLTTRAWWVMAKAEPGTFSQRELSEMCEIDKTSMVTIIDDLETRDLLQRIRSPRDRRAWIISLTDEGRALLAQVRPIVEHVESKLVEAIPADERETFLSVLSRLVETRFGQLEKSSEN